MLLFGKQTGLWKEKVVKGERVKVMAFISVVLGFWEGGADSLTFN